MSSKQQNVALEGGIPLQCSHDYSEPKYTVSRETLYAGEVTSKVLEEPVALQSVHYNKSSLTVEKQRRAIVLVNRVPQS